MPRPKPHPLALFSLRPENERATAVVADPVNAHFVSALGDGTLALDIGHTRSKSYGTLATLGRDADIYVPGSSIAKLQCSFEIDPDTKIILLYDRSHAQTTQVYGENATPFEHGRCRKIVVQQKLNTVLGMGGEGRNLLLVPAVQYEENPRLARTIPDEADTVVPSRRETRIHTPGSHQFKMRYAQIGAMLGAGQFGTVYRAVDVDEGKLMAVKVLKPPEQPTHRHREEWRKSLFYALKREVETLANLSHPYIVDYIASQGWDGPRVEIFMGLKEGSLESLVEGESSTEFAGSLFHQMLQALDCLAVNGIVHRDLKPANILYLSQPNGQYQFQLGDFGLCNRTVNATTLGVGSPIYMAPEMHENGEQTHKVDVWSLYVTMLWTLNVQGFRQAHFENRVHLRQAIVSASKADCVNRITEMASLSPTHRASAAQMLVKKFDGVGLSTPRHQVPALLQDLPIVPAQTPSSTPPPTSTRTPQHQGPTVIQNLPIVAAQSPTPTPPASTVRTPPSIPRALQRNANIFATAARYRVGKQAASAHASRRASTPVAEKRLKQALRPIRDPAAHQSDEDTAKWGWPEERVYFS